MLPSIAVRDDRPSASEEVARLRLQCSDHSLSELVEKDVLERDEDDNVVRKGQRFDEIWSDMR
jgi:hypothetical protein